MRKYGTELLETNYPIAFRKICDIRTLLKYAKNAAIRKNMRKLHIRIKMTCLAGKNVSEMTYNFVSSRTLNVAPSWAPIPSP